MGRGVSTEDEGVAEEDEPRQVPLRRRRVAEARPEQARLPALAQQHQPALPVRVELPARTPPPQPPTTARGAGQTRRAGGRGDCLP